MPLYLNGVLKEAREIPTGVYKYVITGSESRPELMVVCVFETHWKHSRMIDKRVDVVAAAGFLAISDPGVFLINSAASTSLDIEGDIARDTALIAKLTGMKIASPTTAPRARSRYDGEDGREIKVGDRVTWSDTVRKIAPDGDDEFGTVNARGAGDVYVVWDGNHFFSTTQAALLKHAPESKPQLPGLKATACIDYDEAKSLADAHGLMLADCLDGEALLIPTTGVKLVFQTRRAGWMLYGYAEDGSDVVETLKSIVSRGRVKLDPAKS